MAEELKKIIKERTKGKKDPTYVFIMIRIAKDVEDLQVKDSGDGIIELRVHSTDDKFPKWYTHGYLIDLKNLRLTYKEIKKKEQLQEVLLDPVRVVHVPTKQLLSKLEKDFGGILPDGKKKMFWKTEQFKKKKDPYKIKRKAL